MRVVRVTGLPGGALAASARFHAGWLPTLAKPDSDDDLLLVFPPADHTHRGWRLALVQQLARDLAPRRVNAVACAGEAAVAAAADYLGAAEGVTGQYLPLDDAGGQSVLS